MQTAGVFFFLVASHAICNSASVLPLVQWSSDGGTMGVRMYHGNNERMIVTRLAFEVPTSAVVGLTLPDNSTLLSVLPHAAFALRADGDARSAVSAAPTARQSRTRMSFGGESTAVSAELFLDSTGALPDWLISSRWQAGLFLNPHSDIWQRYSCWTIDDLTGAMPALHLEDDTECATRATSAASTWHAASYTYSVPRDGAARKHGRRVGVLTLGTARLVAPSMSDDAQALAVGCTEPHCNFTRLRAAFRVTPAFPIVFDLESMRNYLPASLFYLCNNESGTNATQLELEFLDGSGHAHAFLPCGHGYNVNTDSTEVILGLPFFHRNFSSVTFDVHAAVVHAVFVPDPPSSTIRYMVSLFILVLNALNLVWLDARASYATLVVLIEALTTPDGGTLLPFHVPHIGLELTAFAIGALTLGLTAPYMQPPFVAYFWAMAALWIAYAVIAFVMIAVSVPSLIATIRRWSESYTAAMRLGRDVPAFSGSFIAMAAPLVLARNTAVMFLVIGGIVLGLLLSSDSLLMLALAAVFVALIVYHLSYYVSAALLCSTGLHGNARHMFSSTPWGLFVGFAVLTLVALVVGTQLLFATVILQNINSFYPAIMFDLLGAGVLAVAICLGVWRACGDVFTAPGPLIAKPKAS